MSRSRILSKLIIPIALLTIYSITLYKTATTPVEPTSTEEPVAQTTTNQQSLALAEEFNNVIPRPPQAPSAFTDASNSPEKLRFVVLTDPKMVPAIQATWLKSDDVILGIVHDGEAQAFPIKQMAFHHVVNARVAGEPYLITYCALCSGHAMGFKATIDDIRYTFNIYGIYKGSLALIDRQTASVWNQLDGKILSGPLVGQGVSLQPQVITQGTWDEWRELYPETKVLPQIPDYIDQYSLINLIESASEFQLTALLNKDSRVPLDTFVLGTNIGSSYRAYVITEPDIQIGVINDNLDSTPIVIFFDHKNSFGTVFNASIDDQVLQFSIRGNKFVDSSGSIWDNSGRAIDGVYTGSQLVPVASLLTEWSIWSLYHPETSIYGQ
jgi:hypothetical protein